jgi:hypothetical protein
MRAMLPTTPPSGRSSLSTLVGRVGLAGKIRAGLAVVVLIAGFALTLQLVHGAGTTTTSHSPVQAASGPSTPGDQTPSAAITTTPGASAVATPAPGATPTPAARQMNDVVVTQNQDMQVSCSATGPTPPYTVQLTNTGYQIVSWQIVFALLPGSDNPQWGLANPSNGSIGAGQSASFAITVHFATPCGGSKYNASIKLTYPTGYWQPDIPLTYEGVGPVPVSDVVLASGTQTNMEACPASGVAPASFTVAIQNTGNGIAYPSVDTTKDFVGPKYWANTSMVEDPSNEPVSTWLYPGETWTITVSPIAGVLCDGTIYHVYIYINNSGGPSDTMTITDTFH